VIANSNTTSPLVDGDFSDATLKVNGSLNVTGSMTMGVNSTITSSTTFNGTATIIPVDGSNSVTLTIDSDQLVSGRILIIKKIGGGGNVVVATEGSETIDAASSTLLSNTYQFVTIFCDGSNWWII